MNLKETLYSCLPAGRYALSGMLRLLDVIETDAVPTAAVECHAQPRLLINPAFVEAHAETPEKLMMLVLHEVHHVLLGHTRRIPSETQADNFVFDCVINALLCRMFPQPEYTALFRDFYLEDHFPSCLLRPPASWDPGMNHCELPHALRKSWHGVVAAREVYSALYSRKGATYDELRNLLPRLQSKGVLDGITLLGDHDSSSKGHASAGESAFAEAVGDVVCQWPSLPEPLRGQSLDGILRPSRLAVHRGTGNRKALRHLISRLAHSGRSRNVVKQLSHVQVLVDTPIPIMNRKSIVTTGLGLTPLLYQSSLSQPKALPQGQKVHLYVDVSGSMDAIKGAVYGAVLDCREWLAPSVHLFSTQVAEASIAQIREGFCRSTGGTNIDCVVQHMRRQGVKRAVILTDGYVGTPDASLAAYLKTVQLGVAYTTAHSKINLQPFTKHAVELSTQI